MPLSDELPTDGFNIPREGNKRLHSQRTREQPPVSARERDKLSAAMYVACNALVSCSATTTVTRASFRRELSIAVSVTSPSGTSCPPPALAHSSATKTRNYARGQESTLVFSKTQITERNTTQSVLTLPFCISKGLGQDQTFTSSKARGFLLDNAMEPEAKPPRRRLTASRGPQRYSSRSATHFCPERYQREAQKVQSGRSLSVPGGLCTWRLPPRWILYRRRCVSTKRPGQVPPSHSSATRTDSSSQATAATVARSTRDHSPIGG